MLFFKKLFYLFAFIGLYGFFSFSPALASPAQDEDFGYWSQNDIEHDFQNKWKVKAGEEVRFREHAGLSYYDTHAGFSYQARPFILLNADYLQVRQTRLRAGKDRWYWESRPRMSATLQPKIKGFLLENRNMMEFRFKESAENTMRYRNMTTLTAPWKWTKLQIQPYTSNEVFIETDRNGLTEDRLYGGVKTKISKHILLNIFYLRQSSKNNAGSWKDSNIFGTALKVII